MDADTRTFLEKHFGALLQQLERTNIRPTAVEDPPPAVEEQLTALDDRLSGLEERVGVLEDRADDHERLIESLRLEMRERFISTDERLRTVTLRFQYLQTRVEQALARVSRDDSSRAAKLTSVT
jgi:chromosome segregation ATPase